MSSVDMYTKQLASAHFKSQTETSFMIIRKETKRRVFKEVEEVYARTKEAKDDMC
jgi:hypothetical protein